MVQFLNSISNKATYSTCVFTLGGEFTHIMDAIIGLMLLKQFIFNPQDGSIIVKKEKKKESFLFPIIYLCATT